MEVKEGVIQKAILDYLKLRKVLCFKHRNVGIKKPNGSYIPLSMGEKGISDILGCLPGGRFLAIEVKAKNGVLSEDQKLFLQKVQKGGGVSIVARSVDDVVCIIEPILKLSPR